jgi:uncharacterized protein (DUF2236 family)
VAGTESGVVNGAPLAVSRKINRETVVLFGWGRAILLQIAHPLIAAAVSDFSRFHAEPGGYVRRTRHTIRAMLGLTFGAPEEIDRVIDRINAIHQHVHGTLPERVGRFPAGTTYTATDPVLLAWVHVTLIDSILIAYDTLVGPLSTEEQDRYCVEASAMTMRLGVPAELLPMSAAALGRAMDAMRASGDLAVGPAARELAAALLAPPIGVVRPFFGPVRRLTIGLLPDDIRRAYDFAWDGSRERSWRRLAGFVRRCRGLLPGRLAQWPAARAAV